MKPDVVGLIPARGGSKGVPAKNLYPLAGKPLLQYTCESALASRSLTRIILSTDDEEISELGRRCGVETPFMRPARLASDTTPMLNVMLHALDWLESTQGSPDAIILLQPTSPLRSPKDIDEAFRIFVLNDAATVVSVVEIPHGFAPTSALLIEAGRVVRFSKNDAPARRQDKHRFFARNGPAVLVTSPATLRTNGLYGDPTLAYEMPKKRSYDVDDLEDLAVVDCLLSARKK